MASQTLMKLAWESHWFSFFTDFSLFIRYSQISWTSFKQTCVCSFLPWWATTSFKRYYKFQFVLDTSSEALSPVWSQVRSNMSSHPTRRNLSPARSQSTMKKSQVWVVHWKKWIACSPDIWVSSSMQSRDFKLSALHWLAMCKQSNQFI